MAYGQIVAIQQFYMLLLKIFDILFDLHAHAHAHRPPIETERRMEIGW